MTPSDVARSYLESFSGGDPDAIAAHVAPGFVNEHASALGDGCVGADEYRARLPGFLEAMQGLRYDVDALIADGPRVAVQYRLTATSDGHPVDVRGVMVLDVENQRIAHRTDYWDSLTYLRQTGQA